MWRIEEDRVDTGPLLEADEGGMQGGGDGGDDGHKSHKRVRSDGNECSLLGADKHIYGGGWQCWLISDTWDIPAKTTIRGKQESKQGDSQCLSHHGSFIT